MGIPGDELLRLEPDGELAGGGINTIRTVDDVAVVGQKIGEEGLGLEKDMEKEKRKLGFVVLVGEWG